MSKGNVKSIRELARRLKRSEGAVRRWIADSRWEFGPAPWPLEIVRNVKLWMRTQLEQQPDAGDALAGLSPERRAKIELVIERTAKVRLERELLAGRYLPKADVQADLIGRASEAKRTLESITSLAPRLVNRDEADIRRLLMEHVALVCNSIASGNGHGGTT